MSQKAKKYIVITLAAALCISVFSITAFAQQNQQVTRETAAGTTTANNTHSSSSSPSSSSSNPSSSLSTPSKPVAPSSPSNTGGTGGTGGTVTREPTNSNVTVVFSLNGGSGMRTSASVTKGTTVSEFKTPYRQGYQFAGWAVNGTQVSGSMPINGDTVLTALWQKAAGASSQTNNSVDTRQQQIDQAASEANQAISDPDTLSSQNWGALLSSSNDSSASSEESSQVSSAAAASTGGFSNLLAIGIALIVLGLAGVGTFIYLQFIRKSGGGKGGPGGSGGSGKGSKDDTMVFTDISSYSDGKKHNDDSSVIRSVRQPNPAPKPSPVSDDTQTVPVRTQAKPKPKTAPQVPAQHSTIPPEERRAQSAQNRYLKKAQAKPVDSEKSDFDWEQFFNEDK